VPSTLEGIVFTYAEEELNALGLKYALQPEVTTSVPPDTVIRTNPAGGQLVVPGTTIVIVYAVVPTPSPSASPSASPSPSPSVSTSPR
jgi:beta-lactam-binding protein with PASTA domain